MAAAIISDLVSTNRPELGPYERLYKHFHANPELSNQEKETANTIIDRLGEISADFDIRRNIGGYGIAALLFNGEGSTVLLRADTDALPIEEQTGLEYASNKRMKDADGVEQPVMHACGHDVHITGLLAAADTLVRCRSSWSGTLLLVFQPAQEPGTGAQAMVDDGLYDPDRHAVPIPDLCLGGHVVPSRAGIVATKRGVMAVSADSMRITFHGRRGRASTTNHPVDPIPMAVQAVMNLNTILFDPLGAREVTVTSVRNGIDENPYFTNTGNLHFVEPEHAIAGDGEHVISEDEQSEVSADEESVIFDYEASAISNDQESMTSDEEWSVTSDDEWPVIVDDEENVLFDYTQITLDIKTKGQEQREMTIEWIKQIAEAQAQAWEAVRPPTFELTRSFPATINDNPVTAKLEASFQQHFEDYHSHFNNFFIESQDFNALGMAVNKPCCFFLYGSVDPKHWDACLWEGTLNEKVPNNHTAHFAPAIHPTLKVAADAYAVGALAWLVRENTG